MRRRRAALALALAGTFGAGIAGVIGGLLYGSLAAVAPATEVGGASVLLVMLWLTLAAARSLPHPAWQVAGGTAGGFVGGGAVKLLGTGAAANVGAMAQASASASAISARDSSTP